jgi:hypothetical protein
MKGRGACVGMRKWSDGRVGGGVGGGGVGDECNFPIFFVGNAGYSASW